MGSPTLVLITHFASEIMFTAFLNQGRERPSSGFECHLTGVVAEYIWSIYAFYWHKHNVRVLLRQLPTELWPATGRRLLVTRVWHVTACYMSRLPLTCLQWIPCVGFCFHIVWCNANVVGDREILETYLNSASKNTPETDIFLMGQSLLTSVISHSREFGQHPHSMFV
jgi:hypothetical protein